MEKKKSYINKYLNNKSDTAKKNTSRDEEKETKNDRGRREKNWYKIYDGAHNSTVFQANMY